MKPGQKIISRLKKFSAFLLGRQDIVDTTDGVIVVERRVRGIQPQRPIDVVDVTPEDLPRPSGESPISDQMG